MKFYNRVKDEVQDNGPQEDGGGNVAFDELKKNAEENDVEDEEPDDTEIEDLTGSGTNKEYGDPSKIELNEDTKSQAGRAAAASGDDSGEADRSRQQSQNSQDDSTSSSRRSGQRQQDEDDEDGSEVALTPDGHVRDPGEEPDDEDDNHPSDETQKEILEDMREQNEHIINLLRGIKRSLDRP
jgi:hypothetical protein